MKGNKHVIAQLNELLAGELTAFVARLGNSPQLKLLQHNCECKKGTS